MATAPSRATVVGKGRAVSNLRVFGKVITAPDVSVGMVCREMPGYPIWYLGSLVEAYDISLTIEHAPFPTLLLQQVARG